MHFRDACTYMAVVGLSTTALAAVQPFGQCGGMNYKGDVACASGWQCVKANDWYSQCVPGTHSSPAPLPGSGATVPSTGSGSGNGNGTEPAGDDSCDADEDAGGDAGNQGSGATVPSTGSGATVPSTGSGSGNGTEPAGDDSCDADEDAGADAAHQGNGGNAGNQGSGDGEGDYCDEDGGQDAPAASPSPAPAVGKDAPAKPSSAPAKPSSAPAGPSSAPAPAATPIAGGSVAGSGRNGAKCDLDAAFKAKGKKYVGVATDQYTFNSGKNGQIIIDNFGCVTPENSMKWDATERSQGSFTLDGANALVKFATDNKKMIRGHTTVWHSQLPAWVSQINDKAKLEEVMVNHIKKLLTTYAGKIYAWDVVNEILSEDGGFRSSVFYNVLGEGFVSTAFHAARQADPNAKLYINDYNLDGANYPKTKGMVSHVKKWIAAGVPIDGIGTQSHLSSPGSLFPISGVPAAVKSLCEAAPECAITELDIKDGKPSDWVTVFQGCEDIKNCVGVTVWGVSDTNSWIGAAGKPLLFDGSFQAKPSYNELCSALA